MKFRSFQLISVKNRIGINAKEWGSGAKTCVLVHGFGDGIHIWEDLIQSLGPLFRIVAVDLRGHGDSGWDPQGSYKIQDYVDDVLLLIDTICNDRFSLVGHSLGGEIAIRVAADRKQSVAGVAIVDFGPTLNQMGTDRVLSDFNTSIRTYDSVADYVAWLRERRPLAPPALLERIAKNALRLQADGRAVLKCDPAIGKRAEVRNTEPLWDMLTLIACPTLVIRGTGSAVLSSQTAEQMVKKLVNGRLRTISGAGHAVMTDNPREFCDEVRSFLLELDLI
jgi:pimeloyl-ACP methyl ester carboxylesterase